MVLTVLSIGGLQWYWVQKSYELQKEEFDQQVNRAINQAIDQLSKSETKRFLVNKERTPSKVNVVVKQSESDTNTEIKEQQFIFDHSDEEEKLESGASTLVIEQVIEGSDSVETISITNVWTPDTMRIDTFITKERIHERIAVFGDVVEELLLEELTSNVPIAERLERNNLDSLLSSAFQSEGLATPYTYEVVDNGEIAEPEAYTRQLFPYELNAHKHLLAVHFPDQQSYVLRSMLWLLLGSLGLILLTCLTFAALLIHIRNQKRISQMKSDFLNNMTHEFKTPLATISLAVDSIKHPATRQQPERINVLANIIMQENQRMNAQVERVLQVARLDRQETELQLEPADLNQLVTEVLEQMQLQFNESKAEVVVNLHTTALPVNVDVLHVKNAVRNLLDNAVKYSRETPKITVKTTLNEEQVVLEISDEGIGMSEEQKYKAFDQFYRVTSGNLHDTKGFGLGLYYVQQIVSLHEGIVDIESTLGQGTQVQLKLPKA